MSISSAVMPSARISAQAFALVPSPVAKPGMVKPRIALRGRPSRSIAFAATISAWVESSPPDTPITIVSACAATSRFDSASTWMLNAS